MPVQTVYEDEVGHVPETGTADEIREYYTALFFSRGFLEDRVRTAFEVAGLQVASIEHCRDFKFWLLRLRRGKAALTG